MSLRERPTMAELRGRVQKERHTEIGNWLARRVGRPSAVYGTWLAVRLGLGAHQVTSLALAASIGSALAIGSGGRLGFVAGVALAWTSFWLDHVDGQVARWRRASSLDGVYFDYLLHHAIALTQGFALGFGLAARTGVVEWTVAGFVIGLGWTFLGLHNDCRYKAVFQRLKADGRTFRVDPRSGGRPAPPAPWPRRGRGVVTWPLYKACEPHVVLLSLSILAALASAVPKAWPYAWAAYVLAMAVVAPTLSFARSARSIARGSTEGEFARWFRPVDQPG